MPRALPRFRTVAQITLLTLVTMAAGSVLAASPPPEKLRETLAVEGGLAIEGRTLDRESLRRFYEPRQHLAAWQGDQAVLDRAQLIAALQAAPAHGLDPSDYHVPQIVARQAGDTQAGLELELLLSDAFFRYASHMRLGRINMAAIEQDWHLSPTPFDPVAALAASTSRSAFLDLLTALPPPAPDYKRLMQALVEWQNRLAGPAWPSVMPGPAIKPNMSDSRLLAVRQRLIAEGDLAADKAEGETLDADVVAALKKFQLRYGLEADGLVGARTILTMNISPATRVRQIEANLERLRALPRNIPATAIIVNVPGTTAELVENGEVTFAANVIVGTPSNPTPVLAASFRSLLWNPPWTVPHSIASKEILPQLQRNPEYLVKQNMVILNREDDPQGLTLDWKRYNKNFFPFVLRQLPGPGTALGHVVFEMPNKFDVYLHDTPDRRLFAHGDRYFSHGCVRLENPRMLAAWLLRDNPAWTPEAIDEFIATGISERVALSRPVPIYLVYQTVYQSRDGVLNFRHDIYGRDWRLNLALDRKREGSLPDEARVVVAAAKPAAQLLDAPKKQAAN
ncbi:MAG: putative peptidoglycan-binding domain protein [Alphaproteobacteria bacterium]|nr:putative peptidoglycan-binding domain protein [Alphaproteobacteria bacterium]